MWLTLTLYYQERTEIQEWISITMGKPLITSELWLLAMDDYWWLLEDT
jgi:hypothetical protein